MKVNAEKTCSRLHNTHLFVCVCMCECMFVFIAAIYCQSSCASNANLRRVGVGVLSPVRRCQPNAHMNEWICVLVCAVFFSQLGCLEYLCVGVCFLTFVWLCYTDILPHNLNYVQCQGDLSKPNVEWIVVGSAACKGCITP